MDLSTWIISVLGIGISLTALLFAVFQYLNKTRKSKIFILRKALFFGLTYSIILFIIGYWLVVKPSKLDHEEIVPLPKNKNDETYHGNNIYRHFDDNQLSSQITHLLQNDSVDFALDLANSMTDSIKKDDEYIRICSYCIKNDKLSKADKIAGFLKSCTMKDSIRKIIEFEKFKNK